VNLHKSIDFLLENAGAVIQYRLRKEILRDISPTEETNLLEQIYQLPHFKLVESYVKPNGYIGSGMHSWDNWGGVKLHETPLQDGEAAARLLSNYAVPKTLPIVQNFVAAMRDEDTLQCEFSYIPPEVTRFNDRHLGINGGFSLQILLYTMQAMLGYGDDSKSEPFQDVSLQTFKSVLPLNSLADITNERLSKAKYSYPYIEEGTFFPCGYNLTTLAYTQNWRTPANVQILTDALNHLSAVMHEDNIMHVKVRNKYYAPLGAMNRPIRAFRTDLIDVINYRRTLTEIAMLGVGENVGVIRESAANVREALDADGILRMRFDVPHNKRYSPKHIEYPTAYVDVRLEPDYKRKYAFECDLTFWAVQFLTLVESTAHIST
jgi:hypothetical protein